MSNQDKNILDFKDISISSLISDLPTIINYNNSISRKCFENIYNFDKEYLSKPVKTNGIINGHTGEFKNLIIYSSDSKSSISLTADTITSLKKENEQLKQQIYDISLKIEQLLLEIKK